MNGNLADLSLNAAENWPINADSLSRACTACTGFWTKYYLIPDMLWPQLLHCLKYRRPSQGANNVLISLIPRYRVRSVIESELQEGNECPAPPNRQEETVRHVCDVTRTSFGSRAWQAGHLLGVPLFCVFWLVINCYLPSHSTIRTISVCSACRKYSQGCTLVNDNLVNDLV